MSYKNLLHETRWLQYPEIEPTAIALGAEPTMLNPLTNTPFYTIPFISDPNHLTEDGKPTVVSDSIKIARYLDEKYPSERTLIPMGTLALQGFVFEYFVNSVIWPSFKLCTRSMAELVPDQGQAYVSCNLFLTDCD